MPGVEPPDQQNFSKVSRFCHPSRDISSSSWNLNLKKTFSRWRRSSEKKSWVGFEPIMSDIWRRVGSDAWRHRRWLTAAGLSGLPRSKKDFLMSEVNSSTLELVDTSWSTPHFMTRPEKLLTSCWPRRRRSTWQSTSWKVDGPFRNKVWMI